MSADTHMPPPSAPSPWYAAAMEHLVGVVQELSRARDLDAVTDIVRRAARELTGADGATFVLRDGDKCFYAEENAIAPLWKGKRFPMEICISGWVMLNAKPALIPDIYADPRIPAEAYRPTFVQSLAMVPVRREAPIAAIGNYWASNHTATAEEVAILQALADTTSVALENAQLYASLNDKVEQVQAQAARIQAQHESLEVFARALAHDLKEPVRTVRAFSELIAAHDDPPETKAAYFELVRKAADRMSMLVDTVFEYTQLDDPARVVRRPCDMNQAFSAASDNLAQLIRERAAVVAARELPQVEAHPAHMMQVLQNLIANAIRHGPPGVHVEVSCVRDGDDWRFSVADNGYGVAEADAERIFLPFKRLNLNEEGAGLGLPTCRKIIALHGGRIWCEPGNGGATFSFTLPVPASAPAVIRPADAAPAGTSPPKGIPLANVLLVDDREADVELTRVLLKVRDRMEFNLSVARGGQEALDMLAHADAQGQRIDMVLLDINMPGMDGFEMLERLRGHGSLGNTPVVMCTGSTYDRDIERARELGAAGYMVKPPSLDQLRPLLTSIPAVTLCADTGRRLLRAA